MTASFTAIHFLYDSVIISRQHLKQSTCQGNSLYFKYFLQPSMVMFLLILDFIALGGEKESKYSKKTPFWGSVQKPLAFERFFIVFLLFLDIKIRFIYFTSSRPFFKVVFILFKQKSSDRSFIFFNGTGFSKRSSLSHLFYHLR